MNIKKFCAIALLLSTAAASAYHDDQNGDPEGFRWGIGLRAGAAAFAGRLESLTTITDVTVPATPVVFETTAINNYVGINSFQGGVFVEAAYRSCDWSIGILVDANGDTLKKDFLVITDTLAAGPLVSSDTFSLKSPVHIGADIRGGMYWDNALLYLLVGGEAIRYEYVHTLNLQQAPFAVATPAALVNPAADQKFWRGAVRAGLGIEYNISDCFKLGLEYRFIWAGTRTQPIAVTPSIPVVVDMETINYTLSAADVLHFRQHVTALTFAYMF